MKRLLALSLVILYINSNTEFHELLRMPVLIDHYQQHKQLVKDISFWDFLVMHYKTNVAHDADDNQLPFKDPAHSFTSSILALPLPKIILQENEPAMQVAPTYFYCEPFFSSPLNKIFQPPRLS